MDMGAAALTAIEKPKTKPAIVVQLENRVEELTELYKGDRAEAQRFIQSAINFCRVRPEITKCNVSEVLGCFASVAEMGLSLNKEKHECFINIYKGTPTIEFEYRGLLKLAWNSGLIKSLNYGLVIQEELKDNFKVEYGTNEVLSHIPIWGIPRKNPVVAYIYTQLVTGAFVSTVMNYDEAVEHGRKFSRSFNSVWLKNTGAMVIKTVIKEHLDKKLPKYATDETARFAQFIGIDGAKVELVGDKMSFESIKAEPIEFVDETTGEIIDNFLQEPPNGTN